MGTDTVADRRAMMKLGAMAGLAATAAATGTATAAGAKNTMAARKNLTIANITTPRGTGLAVRTARGALDVAGLSAARGLGLPMTVEDVIHGRGDGAALTALLAKGPAALPAAYVLPERQVRFAPVVTNPEKILCMGLNYRAHAAEGGQPPPKTPILFNKYNTSLNRHGGTIRVSAEDAKQFDYEAEMVIVMGKTARDVSEADALSYVFGYCTGQDFTARDLQMLTSQWMLGKCGDGWGPLGPWLLSGDQVDPDNLDIKQFVNGEVRQSSNTKMMIFSCRQMISYISRHMTLKPGDVIFTGTPEGVIMGMPKEKQVWLKPGDKLVTSIEKLGDLEVTLT